MQSIWTPERDARLRELKALGQSGTEIGALMGLSRNAVIGRCWRLGILTGRVVDTPEQREAKRQVRRAHDRLLKRQRKVLLKRLNPLKRVRYDDDGNPFNGLVDLPFAPERVYVRKPVGDSPPSLNLPFKALRGNHCRFPYGEGPYFFCGQEVAHTIVHGHQRSYCQYHFQLCHSSAKEPLPTIKARGWGSSGVHAQRAA